jgi:2,3-bisphosphoglycerate-dependent phosphoglycerate mutase
MNHFKIFSFSLLFVLFFSCAKEKKSVPEKATISTYYFIRHAEKDRSDDQNKNPHLIDIGLKRANNWSSILGNIKFDAVYSTDYNRTKETAQPTASKNGLEITFYDPGHIDGKAFINENKGKTVLIVGHSNTTPLFVNAILGSKKYEDIDDNTNGNLYIVTIIDEKIIDQVLTIN